MGLKNKSYKEKLKKDILKKYLISHQEKSEQLYQWLSGVVKNYVYNNNISIEDDFVFDEKIKHIINYLLSKDSPRKFYSMTFQEADKQTSDWNIILQKRSYKNNENDISGIKKFLDLKKSWVSYSLESEESLLDEGEKMQHCVGSYYSEVKNGLTKIFSIRDENFQPHITIQVTDNNIVQAYGKNNKIPKENYMTYFYDFLEKSKLGISKTVSSYLKIKTVTIGRKNYYIENELDYNNKVLEFLEKNPFNNDGGEIYIKNIKNLESLNGIFDSVIIEGSTILNIDNLFAKNITIIDSKINKINNLKSNNASILFSMINDSFNIEANSLSVNESTFPVANLQKTKSFNCKNQFLKNIINSTSNTDLFFENTFLQNNENLTANSVKLINSDTLLETIINSKINTFFIDNYFKKEISDSFKNANSVFIMKAPNLLTLKNTELHEISINNAPNLLEINNIVADTLSIDKNDNIELIERCKIKKLKLKTTSNKLVTKRNRISKLTTNNPKIFKGKTIKNTI